uniref:Glycosyl transferases group 1-like protein n=1 Tax=Vibrio parahaemolyticus TaxID=670 RepID=A0A5P4S7B4_VIBPH|nr:glycosyl transferases group 1-like protein [Vibrio parahaemolyticus]
MYGKSTKVSRKKILILAEYIGENHNSTAYYWSQIVRKIRQEHDVILITPDTEHARGFSKQYEIETHYVKYSKHNKNSLISRLNGQLSQTITFIRGVKAELKNVDLVFSGTNPIVTMFGLALLKSFQPFKWLVLVHDVFPNNLIPAKVINKSSFSYRFLTALSKKVYSSPEQLICIGRDMKELLDNKTEGENQIEFIPNWASTERIVEIPKKDNELILKLGWQDNTVFQFFGNMGRLQGIGQLLEAIGKTKCEKSRFLFIGCGSEAKQVQHVAKRINAEVGYERVHYYGRLDLEKNNLGLNACDVALVTLAPEMFGLGVPSKAYFSMAANKPIVYVGDKNSELERLLSEYELGWYCNNNNVSELSRLLDYVSELNYSSSLPQTRDVLISHFSEKIALDAIAHQVSKMVLL